MGLREKVTITLVIIALIQIACRHCMPRTPRKASLKRYLNDLKPVKNNPVPTPYSPFRVNKIPKQTFGKTAENARISQDSLPNKSLYKKYNFPEIEYPLDTSPRDPFRFGMNFNDNYHVNTAQKGTRNLQSSVTNDMKKDMKMKRKLLSNENSQLKRDMSTIKVTSSPDSIRLLETFPEVQYPLNTMQTWEPNYWNYLPFTQEKQFNGFERQTFNPKIYKEEDKPFTRLTKATASQFLQSYDKLKEEQRRTSTENSKRSNVGQTGLNFTKTATCEKVSEDFITAGMVSNIPRNSLDTKTTLESTTDITSSSENTCPVTEYRSHSIPIPYKVIEEGIENICPAFEVKNNTEESEDVNNTVIAQTLQLIKEILFNDDTSSTAPPSNFGKVKETNINFSDYADVPVNKDVPITLIDNSKCCIESPTEESSLKASDTSADILQNNMPAKILLENATTVVGPLNVGMPLPFTEPIKYDNGAINLAPLTNSNAVSGSTSIIIIPINNNAVGNSQSHMFETISGTPIIVYIPSTQSSGKTTPNNQLCNAHSNMAPLQNDNSSSTVLVSEFINDILDIGLPMYEKLPTNSMCYNNNENSPTLMREKPVSDILIHKSLTDDASLVTPTYDEKMLVKQPETLPPTPDFEHPLFNFHGSEFSSLNHGPYNNILHNELPIIAREINSDQQITNVSFKDLFISTQNVTSQYLHKNISVGSVLEDSLSGIPNDVSSMALDTFFSPLTPADNLEILKSNAATIISESPLYSLPVPLKPSPISEKPSEILSQSIDKIHLPISLIETSTGELPLSTEASFLTTPLSEFPSDKLPLRTDAKLPPTPDTTMDSATQSRSNKTLSSPISNSPPMTTDMKLLKTTSLPELYKDRQLLNKMLPPSETSSDSLPLPLDKTLAPISDSHSLPPLMDKPLQTSQIVTDNLTQHAEDKTLPPPRATDSPIDSLQQVHKKLSPIPTNSTSTDTHPLLMEKSLTVLPTTPVSESLSDNNQYLMVNLVIPLSKTVTIRTKDTPPDDLPRTMNDLPLKMDVVFPDYLDFSRDELPLSVKDLSITKHQHPHIFSKKYLPMKVDETLTPLLEVPINDVLSPTDELSLSVKEVLGAVSSSVQTDSVTTIMGGSMDKVQQDFPPSKTTLDGLPNLPINVSSLPIHETPERRLFEEPFKNPPPLKNYLPISADKFIPDFSFSDIPTNEPLSMDDSSLPLNDKITGTENDLSPDILVTDIPIVSLSLNKGLQMINPDKTSDEESSLSDTAHDLSLPKERMLPLPGDKPGNLSLPKNKTLSYSKLPITKALLENVLSDITKGGFSSPVTKALPVTPPSLLHKTIYYVDEESPNTETNRESLLLSVNNISSIIAQSDNPTDIIHNPGESDNTLFMPVDKVLPDTLTIDTPSDFSLPKDEIYKDKHDILTGYVEDEDKNLSPPSENPALNHTPSDISAPRNITQSASKLPVTKALLENDITTRDFSLPVAQSFSVTSSTLLDKSLYYIEPPYSVMTEKSSPLPLAKIFPSTAISDHPTDNSPFSGQTGYTLPLAVDKRLTDIPSLYSAGLSSPIDKIHPDKSDMSMYDTEQDENEDPFFENPTDVSSHREIPSLTEDTPGFIPLSNSKTPSASNLPITKALLENALPDIKTDGFLLPVPEAVSSHSLPMGEILSLTEDTPGVILLSNSKTPSASNLPITKALLENALLDNKTNDFSLSVAEAVPVTSRSVLKAADKTLSDIPILYSAGLSLPIDKIRPNKSDISMYDVEQDKNENQFFENPTDVSSHREILSLTEDTPGFIPLSNNKTPAALNLPITKALLENVLSDIKTNGFSLPVEEADPVKSRSVLKAADKTLSDIPILYSAELSSPIDKICPNKSDISMYDVEQDKNKNQFFEKPTDVSSHREILSLTEDTPGFIPLSNNKTPAASNLPITKALLENVLSDIKTNGFSLPVEEADPVKSRSVLKAADKTLSDIPILYSAELSSPIDKICPNKSDISMYDVEQDKNENQFFENPTDVSSHREILSLTEDTPGFIPLSNNKTPAASNLPITKALLENVLSDIKTNGFSLPVEEADPVKSRSKLKAADKTLSDIPILYSAELSSPIDKIRLDKSDISTYDVEQDKNENQFFENPTDVSSHREIPSFTEDTSGVIPLSNSKTPSASNLLITKALLENVLSDIKTNSFSLSVPEAVSSPLSPMEETPSFTEDTPGVISLSNSKAPSASNLPITKALLESELSDIKTNSFSSSVAEAVSSNPSPMGEIPSLTEDTPGVISLSNSKAPSASNLPITKALLENVLSDIKTNGFSLSVPEAIPITSRSVLDKGLYFIDSPISDMTENSPSLVDKISPHTELSDISADNFPSSETDEGIFPLPTDEAFPHDPNLDIFTDELPMSKLLTDKSNILTKDVENADINETPSLDNPTNNLLSQTNKQRFLTDDLARIPMTKALLEKVLSEITDEGFASKDPFTSSF